MGLIPAHAGKTTTPAVLRPAAFAHPRSRGENQARRACLRRVRGSSPLTRGKPERESYGLFSSWLIPAHAGKTRLTPYRSIGPRAHPRSRGENEHRPHMVGRALGSSPLTRGKLPAGRGDRLKRGLIPAHAGKTTGRSGEAASNAAHPRSRGENCRCSLFSPSLRGSSPLTRGKRRPEGRGRIHRGLIPAHAGKTGSPRRFESYRRAHPRSRGENTRKSVHGSITAGSSPLTRGKPPQRRSRCPARWAHPRSRGENSGLIPFNVGLGGSSPLTRGKQRGRLDADGRTGLIPAHAGKTGRVGGVENSHRAHPRSRGENGRDDFGGAAVSGSSPLTRGKRQPSLRLIL